MAVLPVLDESLCVGALDPEDDWTADCCACVRPLSASASFLTLSRRTATMVCSSPGRFPEDLTGVSCTVSFDWKDWMLSGVRLSDGPEGLLETALLPLLEESLYLSRRG